MCRAGEAIKYCIGNRRVVDNGMPVFDRQLTINDGGAFADTIAQKLQKIMLAARRCSSAVTASARAVLKVDPSEDGK